MEEQEKQTEYMRGVPPHDETAEQAVLCSMFSGQRSGICCA